MHRLAGNVEVLKIGVQPERKAAHLDLVPIQGDAGNRFTALKRGKFFLERTGGHPPMDHHGGGQKQEKTGGRVKPEAAGIFEHVS